MAEFRITATGRVILGRTGRLELIASGYNICAKCKTTKSIDQFDRSSENIGGYKSTCKACRAQYETPKKDARWRERYDSDPEFRRRFNKYGQNWRENNPGYFAAYNSLDTTLDAKRRIAREMASTDQGLRMHAAHVAVQKAIRRGDLTRMPCSRCGSTHRVHAHHHNGYDPAHHLDVVWLCTKCHGREHGELRIKELFE